MFFQSRNSHTSLLCKDSKVLRSFNKTAYENCIFISKSFKRVIVTCAQLLFQTLTMLDDQNLVILKYPLTALKPMEDIQCL